MIPPGPAAGGEASVDTLRRNAPVLFTPDVLELRRPHALRPSEGVVQPLRTPGDRLWAACGIWSGRARSRRKGEGGRRLSAAGSTSATQTLSNSGGRSLVTGQYVAHDDATTVRPSHLSPAPLSSAAATCPPIGARVPSPHFAAPSQEYLPRLPASKPACNWSSAPPHLANVERCSRACARARWGVLQLTPVQRSVTIVAMLCVIP